MGQTKITARVAGAVLVAGLLAGCEGAVERRAGKRLAPDTPVVDAGIRTLARAHSQDGCDAGQVLTSPDPDATYGPGSIELTDRELLSPALDPPKTTTRPLRPFGPGSAPTPASTPPPGTAWRPARSAAPTATST